MMANLSDSDRRALRFGGFGVVAILIVMLVGLPVMDYWDGLNRRLEQNQAKLRTIQGAVLDSVEARTAMERLRAKATLHPDPAALNQQTARMLRQVETLPGYTGLKVQRLEGLPLREDEGLYRSAVSLQFAGTLPDLHRFLQQVEGASPGLKVERLNITADAKDTTRVEGQMVIAGYAVVMQEKKKA